MGSATGLLLSHYHWIYLNLLTFPIFIVVPGIHQFSMTSDLAVYNACIQNDSPVRYLIAFLGQNMLKLFPQDASSGNLIRLFLHLLVLAFSPSILITRSLKPFSRCSEINKNMFSNFIAQNVFNACHQFPCNTLFNTGHCLHALLTKVLFPIL